MAKGVLSYEKWSVSGSDRHFLAERIIDGQHEGVEINAHCKACAKAELLVERGGRVDLRGAGNGECGMFLRSIQESING